MLKIQNANSRQVFFSECQLPRSNQTYDVVTREMELEKPRIFIFGWPGFLGGADTKLAHLLILLYEHCDITVIPNENRHLHNKTWTKGLDKLGVKYTLIDRLPARLSGFALAMSNQCFFTHRIAHRAKEKGGPCSGLRSTAFGDNRQLHRSKFLPIQGAAEPNFCYWPIVSCRTGKVSGRLSSVLRIPGSAGHAVPCHGLGR